MPVTLSPRSCSTDPLVSWYQTVSHILDRKRRLVGKYEPKRGKISCNQNSYTYSLVRIATAVRTAVRTLVSGLVHPPPLRYMSHPQNSLISIILGNSSCCCQNRMRSSDKFSLVIFSRLS